MANSSVAATTITITTTTTSQSEVVLGKKVPQEKFRVNYSPPEYVIKHAELHFDLDEKLTTVRSNLSIHRTAGTAAGCDLVLDGEDLCLKSVVLNGKTLVCGSDFSIDSEERLVVQGRLLPSSATEIFKLEVEVTINPSDNLQLMGLFKSGSMLCTQCEAEGFRRITYFIDRPDNMSTFRVCLSGDKQTYPVLLSNGNKTSEGEDDNTRHFAVFDDPHPKPCYLFGLVAGDLGSLNSTYQHPSKPDGKKVSIGIYSDRSDLKKLDWAMESIKKAMQWDEDEFGLEYDLDVFNIVCVRDFNMGAMENKSLNVFVSSLVLATPETSTDADYLRILGVIGHEYFHNWTGNRVTCRDWFQLTLKEGLTVFRDQSFSAAMGSKSVQRIEDVVQLRARQFTEDAGPMAHPIRPESYIAMDNFYTATVYEKGAEVIRMYRTILGREGFRAGMDLYFKRHDGHAVTCDDFRSAMADANNFDFTKFERWYLQAGTPEVTVNSTEYDSVKKTFTFKVQQETRATPGQPTKLPFHIPLTVGLIGRKQLKEIAVSKVFHFTKKEEEFVLEGVEEEPILSILRDFSAPVKLRFEQSDEDLSLLMGYDTDDFNRWDAGQKLLLRILLDRAIGMRDGTVDAATVPDVPKVVVDAFRRVLTDDNLDMSFRAFALVLPTEEVISQEMRPCCPIAVHQARESLRRQIARALSPQMEEIYGRLTKLLENKVYRILPDSDNVAPRRLRNLLLSYLTSCQSEAANKLAFSHFTSAQNMTDKHRALQCLADSKSPERAEVLNLFFEQAAGDQLVIDKWFGIQAGADHEDVLRDVMELRQHPCFTMKTPSRMRSLIVRYAMNLAQFHNQNAEGYKFVADAVIELDAFNSQIAARLATALCNWRIYDEERQRVMKLQLERILATPNLSSDTYEIVTKSMII